MTNLRKKTAYAVNIIMLVLIGGSVIFAAVFFINNREKDFSIEKWQNEKAGKRYQYIESLEEQYNLEGMDRKQIDALLGPPSYEEESGEQIIDYEYRIEETVLGGWKVYSIRFENDKVSDTRVMWEDW